MFDEIHLKKRAYESSLEIFRRLHNSEDTEKKHSYDKPGISPSDVTLTASCIKSDLFTRLPPDQNKRYLPFIDAKPSMASEDACLSIESNGKYTKFITESLDIEFDECTSDLDDSAESISSISSEDSDNKQQRITDILAGSPPHLVLPAESISSISSEDSGNTQQSITDILAGGPAHLPLPDSLLICEKETYVKECLEIDHGNIVSTNETPEKVGDLDLKKIILSPDGGAELLQSEEYLRNIETPVLINILNELTSGEHDELLPLSTCVNPKCENFEKNVLSKCDLIEARESPLLVDVVEENIPFTQTNQYKLQNESISLLPESTALTPSLFRSSAEKQTQCQLIKELRDMKEDLSHLHKTIKLSTSEESLQSASDIEVEGNPQVENVGQYLCPPFVNNIRIGSTINKNGKGTLETNQGFIDENIKAIKDRKQDELDTMQITSLNDNTSDIVMNDMNNRSKKESLIYSETVSEYVTKDKNEESMAARSTTLPNICYGKGKLLTDKQYEFEVNDKRNVKPAIYRSVGSSTSPEEEFKVVKSINVTYDGVSSEDVLTNSMREVGSEKTHKPFIAQAKVVCREAAQSNESESDSNCDKDSTSMYMKSYIFDNQTISHKRVSNENQHEDVSKSTHSDQREVEEDKLFIGGCSLIDLRKLDIEDEKKLKPRIVKFVELEICDCANTLSNTEQISDDLKIENETSESECDKNPTPQFNDYQNIYLKEYIFEKNLKNLDEEYMKITQVLDALQVDIERCITMPTNKNILENKLVEEKLPQDVALKECDQFDDPVEQKSNTFENDIRDINEGMKQVSEITDAFEIELNDIICNPLRKISFKKRLSTMQKLQSGQKTETFGIPGKFSEVIESDITAITEREKDVSTLAHQYLSKLEEPVYTTEIKNEEIDLSIEDEDDDVFFHPDSAYEKERRAILNAKKQRIFEEDVRAINNAMIRFHMVSGNYHHNVVTDDIYLRQCIIEEARNIKNLSSSSEEGPLNDYIDSKLQDLSMNVKKEIFEKDIKSINDESECLSGRSDDHIQRNNEKSITFNIQTKFTINNERLDRRTSRDKINKRKPNGTKSNDIQLPSRGMFDKKIPNNDEERGHKEMSQFSQKQNENDLKPIDVGTILDYENDLNDTQDMSDDNETIYKPPSPRSGTFEVDDIMEELSTNFSNIVCESENNNQTNNEVELLLLQLERSHGICIHPDHINILEDGMMNNSVTSLVDNETNNGVKFLKEGIDLNAETSKTFSETCVADEMTSSESDGYQSPAIDSGFDDKEANADSSLEDVIEELLTVGGTTNKPFESTENYPDTEPVYVEIPKICLKLKSKYKANSKLQEEYLPRDKKQRKANVTVELSSSGLLPDKDDIDPYLSSVQMKDIQRPKNNISIEMSSSGSIPDDDDVTNYFSYEPFKMKSFGVT